jgi:hypothetical protein
MTGNKGISNVDVVVYVLAILGGAERTVYSEDIAAKSYDLAPGRFSWKLSCYKEKGWPDKYVAKTALEDAKKGEYGALVEGSYALEIARDGWRLTPAGAVWFKQSRGRIEKELGAEGSIVPKKDIERFMKVLGKQPLYKKYLQSKSLNNSTIYELADMLNCSPDAPKDVITRKFRRLLSMAELANRKDIVVFLEACYTAFPQLASNNAEREEG